MSQRRSGIVFAVLVPAVLLVVVGSTLLGPRWLGWGGITDVTWRELAWIDRPDSVYWLLRVPRTLLAALVGSGLAVGGVIYQSLFRNPLAEPYTLGVASGASLAASVGFLWGWYGQGLAGVPRLTLLAFLGAVVAMGLVCLIHRARPQRDMTRLLLAGICVAYMCSAGILVVHLVADRAVTSDIVRWMMGSFAIHRPRAILEVALVLVPVLGYAMYVHRALDLLTLGEDVATTRGVHVTATVWACYGLVGLLTAVIVANCGPIGFVGLMVPHIGRALFGVRTLPLLGGSALVGAAFMALCDGLARSLPVTELPVGVVTNTLGAVFFLYMLATRDVARPSAGV